MHVRLLTGRGRGVHAVPHVTEGTHSDADRLLLVVERGVLEDVVHAE